MSRPHVRESSVLRRPRARSAAPELSVVQHPGAEEPRSLTDARARVDERVAGPAPQRRSLGGVPSSLVLADVAALGLTALLADTGALSLPVFAGVLLLTRAAMRLYRPRLRLSLLDEAPRALTSVVMTVGLLVVAGVLTGAEGDGRGLIVAAGVFTACSLLLQGLTLAVGRAVRVRRGPAQRTLIIGAGRVGGGIARALVAHPELGLAPIGFTDPDALTAPDDLPLPLVSTDLGELSETLARTGATTVIMAFSAARESQIVDTMITAHQKGCAVLVVPRMFELHHDGSDIERVRGVPLVRLRPDPTLRPSWWVKRAVDVVGALLAIVVLAPFLAAIALAVLLGTGRPLLFRQERIGLDGRVFSLFKFRSMQPVDGEAAAGWTVRDDPRMTRTGSFLRRTSLDELPQLFNIVRGDMSFVGPRPERPTYVARFSDEHERYWARHRVPVGLTGLAQVNGLRGDTSIRERARYDNYYIANWSLWLDVRIAMLTVREVLTGSGR